MGEIKVASQEQSIGVGQVNEAVAQMDEMTQRNAALVEEAAAAATGLEQQAVKLAQAVSVFKLPGGGARAGGYGGEGVEGVGCGAGGEKGAGTAACGGKMRS